MSADWVDLSPPAKHHDQGVAALDVVHAPAGAEKLAHLADAFAHRLHIAQNPTLRFIQPLAQTDARQPVLQAAPPLLEFWGLFDREYGLSVITC